MTSIPIEQRTVAELKEYAACQGIDLSGAKTKAEIIDRINEAPRTASEDGVLDVDSYELPVVEDANDTQYAAFIAGSTLIVRLDDPGEIRVPLKMTYAKLKALREGIGEDADELDQLLFLLESVGDDALIEQLTTEVDLADALAIAALFFRAWKQRTRVSLGKLRRSSRK